MLSAPRGRLGCRQVMRVMQAFLDGEVDPRRAELVAAHLESCRRCEIESETVGRVIAAIRALRPDLDLTAYTRLSEVVERLDADRGPDAGRGTA